MYSGSRAKLSGFKSGFGHITYVLGLSFLLFEMGMNVPECFFTQWLGIEIV